GGYPRARRADQGGTGGIPGEMQAGGRFPVPLVSLCLLLFGEPAGYADGVRQAREELARHDTMAALTTLDQALRAAPDDVEALALLGKAYLGLEKYPQAAAALSRAMAIADRGTPDPETRIDIRIDLAVALARQERSDEAIGVLKAVLDLAPGRPTIHHDIGRIEMAVGQDEPAVAEFRKEIEIQGARTGAADPSLAMSWEGLGIAACRLGDDATALGAFEKRARLPGGPPSVE